jgi:hypothetical protein
MLAVPAMPNARARQFPMMTIIMAPDIHNNVCACSIERPRSLDGWWFAVTSRPTSAATTSFESSTNGDVPRITCQRLLQLPFEGPGRPSGLRTRPSATPRDGRRPTFWTFGWVSALYTKAKPDNNALYRA